MSLRAKNNAGTGAAAHDFLDAGQAFVRHGPQVFGDLTFLPVSSESIRSLPS